MKSSKVFLIFLITGFLLYANSLGNGFVMDMENMIQNTTVARSLENIPKFFIQSGDPSGDGNILHSYYRPLSLSSYPLLFVLFGGGNLPFQLARISIHIVNVFLVYLLGKKLLGGKVSIVISLLLLMHPLNVETVHYSIEDLLSFGFGLSALLLVVYKHKYTYLSPFLLFFSLLSKETGVLFVMLIPFFAYFLHGKALAKKTTLYSVVALIVYLLLRLLSATSPAIFSATVSPSPIMLAPFTERLLTIPKVLSHYIIVLFFPFKLLVGLTWVVKSPSFSQFVLPLLFSVSFISLAFLYVKRLKEKNFRYLYLCFLLWIALGFGIHSQIVPIDVTVADRFTYFFLPAVLLGIGLVIQNEQQFIQKNKSLFLTLLLITIAFFSVRTVVRNTNWKDNYTIHSHDIVHVKDNWSLHNGYGDELFRRGFVDEAEAEFFKSVQIAPHEAVNWTNLATVHAIKGDIKKAEEEYQKAIQNDPTYYKAYEAYGYILMNSGRLDEAEAFLVDAVKRFPQQPQLFIFLAQVQFSLEKFDKAAQSAKSVYDLIPTQQNFQIYQQFIQRANTN